MSDVFFHSAVSAEDSVSLLRPLVLPRECTGSLFLMGMPGADRADGCPEEVYREMRRHRVNFLMNLAEWREVAERSAVYATDWRNGFVPAGELLHFPMQEFAVPGDSAGFADTARSLAQRLHTGGVGVIHCSNGIVRTGMMAIAVLMSLGAGFNEARQAVRAAGSGAEAAAHRAFLAEVERSLYGAVVEGSFLPGCGLDPRDSHPTRRGAA